MVEDGDLETYVGMLYLSISIIIDVENLYAALSEVFFILNNDICG